MGIKSFNKFLKDMVPDVFQKCNLESLAGTRIAVDGENLARIYMSVARKQGLNQVDVINDPIPDDFIFKTWIRMVIQILVGFLEHHILPIVVFDGEMVPEKEHTRQHRKNNAMTRKNDIQQIRSQDYISQAEAEKLLNLECQNIWVKKEDLEGLRDILGYVGIPWIIATGEAEKLCAQLCIDGFAYAAYSKDTDCIALGCPVMICDKKKNEITIIQLNNIKSALNMNYNQLVDLCIMCGCDFNENIRGIGPKISYKLLTQYGSIEGIIPHKPKANFNVLNYERCRSIFKPEPLANLIAQVKIGYKGQESELKFVKPDETSYELLKQSGLSDIYERLTRLQLPDFPNYERREP